MTPLAAAVYQLSKVKPEPSDTRSSKAKMLALQQALIDDGIEERIRLKSDSRELSLFFTESLVKVTLVGEEFTITSPHPVAPKRTKSFSTVLLTVKAHISAQAISWLTLGVSDNIYGS